MISSLEEFRAFSSAFDDLQGFFFDEKRLREVTPGQWQYNTVARDEANFKQGGILRWSVDGGFEWEGFFPETADEIHNLLQRERPAEEREFTLYVKISLRCPSEDEAETVIRKILGGHENLTIDGVAGDTRTAQFM